MIAGNPSRFAIESEITGYVTKRFPGCVGYFVVHVAGETYCRKTEDATDLPGSFDAVEERLQRRGRRQVEYLESHSAHDIAEAYIAFVYAGEEHVPSTNSIDMEKFIFVFGRGDCVWMPDGTEAADDGSHLIQFDVQDRVRLIAFRSDPDALVKSGSLRELMLGGDEFYGVCDQWRQRFRKEWEAAAKC